VRSKLKYISMQHNSTETYIILAILITLSPVFCCYQQVYDIFNMSCLGMILQVSGLDGMSIPQNGATAYSQYHVSHICQGGFPLPSPRVFVFLSILLLSPMVGPVLPNCRDFPLTSLSLANSQLLMQTPRAWPVECYRVTCT